MEALGARASEVARRAAPLAGRKSELLARSRTSPFWKDKSAARSALDEVHRLEVVVEAASRAEGAARAAAGLLSAPAAQRRAARLDERLDGLAREVAWADGLVRAAESGDLGDAYVRITRVKAEVDDLDAVARLAAMYEGYAKRRGLEVETVDDRRTGDPVEDSITLLVSGAGAHALLAGEEGFHPFVSRHGRTGKGAHRPARAWARVDVLPVPDGDDATLAEAVRVRTKSLRAVKGRRIAKPALEVSLLHEPTMVGLTAWAAGAKEPAVGRLLPLLRALVERSRRGAGPAAVVVRRYELGASPRASDRRTHRDTGHVDRVLRGELDLLLPVD